MERRSFLVAATVAAAAGTTRCLAAAPIGNASSTASQETPNDPIRKMVFCYVEQYDPTPGKELAKALASRAAEEWRREKAEFNFVWKPAPARLLIYRRGELLFTQDFLETILGDPKCQRRHEFDYVVGFPLSVWSQLHNRHRA